MKYQIEDWVWHKNRKWKIMEQLYSANMVLQLLEHALDLYDFFGKEDLEQIKRNLKNEIWHLANALKLEKERDE